MERKVSSLIEENYVMLKSKAKKQCLLCIEDIIDSLKDPSLVGLELLITSHKNSTSDKDIIPSLSVAKNFKSDNITKIYNLNEIVDIVISKQKDPPDKFESLWDEAEKSGLKLLKYEDLNITIALRLESDAFQITDFQKGNLEIIAKSLDLIKRNSLNIWNEYQDQIRNDLISLKKSFSRSKTETLIEFCKFIEKKYSIKTYCFELDSNLENWIDPHSRNIQDRRYPNYCKSIIENSKEKFKYKKPVLGKSKNRYFLIIPFKKDDKDELIDKVILVTSVNSIPQDIPRNIDQYIQYYFNSFLEEVKGKFLSKLQEQIKEFKIHQSVQEGILNIHELLTPTVPSIFNDLLTLTNAFSVTIRLFNPKTNSLDLLFENKKDGVVKHVTKEGINDIPINSNWSVNATAFRNCTHKKPYIYVKDLSRKFIKRKNYCLLYRENAKSEICFPIFFKNVKIGTFNLESPRINGFRNDIEFISNIKRSIDNHISLVYDIHDKSWMANTIKVKQNIHEIKQIINSDDFPPSFRDLIHYYITEMRITSSNRLVKIGNLLNFHSNYLKKLKHYSHYSSLKKGCKINIESPDTEIQDYKLDMLQIIYQNLLDNYRKYGDIERDIISLSQDRNRPFYIKFIVKSSSMIRDDIINKCLIVPFESFSGKEKRIHDGLFIVGMLARHLSGYSYIFNNYETGKSFIYVYIPLEELS
jgi:hypothetical protein